MNIERKKDLSIYYWLKDKFSQWSFVTISDGFPESNLDVPTIAVEWADIDLVPKELGNRDEEFLRFWAIDVFGKNKSQSDDYTYYILDELKNVIPVYDFDEGFPDEGETPEDAGITQLGYLQVTRKRAKNVKIIPELVEELYWRATITFFAEYAEI